MGNLCLGWKRLEHGQAPAIPEPEIPERVQPMQEIPERTPEEIPGRAQSALEIPVPRAQPVPGIRELAPAPVREKPVLEILERVSANASEPEIPFQRKPVEVQEGPRASAVLEIPDRQRPEQGVHDVLKILKRASSGAPEWEKPVPAIPEVRASSDAPVRVSSDVPERAKQAPGIPEVQTSSPEWAKIPEPAISLERAKIPVRAFSDAPERAKQVIEIQEQHSAFRRLQVSVNLLELESETKSLKVVRDELARKIKNEIRPRMIPLAEVQSWLTVVNAVVAEVDELVQFSISADNSSTEELQDRVRTRIKEVVDLRKAGSFRIVTARPFAEAVIRLPAPETVVFESKMDEVLRILKEENVGIMGIYGVGGIGKTTLLKQINNRLSVDPNNFDVVIWVAVSKDLKIEKVQDQIGRRLGFQDAQWCSKSVEEKAVHIFKALRKLKFVLFLDDVWERVNLIRVGIPHKLAQNGSKVIITTRSREVCDAMGAKRIIPLDELSSDDALNLFKKIIGKDKLEAHPDIPPLAQLVAKACGNSPLAIVATARAMASQDDLGQWKRALQEPSIEKSANPLDKVNHALKLSYDALPNDKVKSLFLYCTLFPEDHRISKHDLVDCWICDKFEGDSGLGSRKEGYSIIDTLINVCLLESDGKCIHMHNVVRHVALTIASENLLAMTSAKLIEPPEVKEWEGMRRMSLMDNSIENIMDAPICPNLLTLFLSHNQRLFNIIDGFFSRMSGLTVLDLSNSQLRKLPQGISSLVSLQYLNLSHTSIRQLPLELRLLANLVYLNLEHNKFLDIVPKDVISRLLLLQVLRMFCCRFSLADVEDGMLSNGKMLLEELEVLKHLSMLSITIRHNSAWRRFSSNHKLLDCTQALSLDTFGGSEVLDISFLANMAHLETLLISESEELKEFTVDVPLEGEEIHAANDYLNLATSPEKCFTSLLEVKVDKCFRLQDLTWLILAPNLTFLQVAECPNMLEIISGEKLGHVRDDGRALNIFEKLEVLVLQDLPLLRSIYRDPLPFTSLNKIQILNCSMLKRLPLNSESAKQPNVAIEAEASWWEKVEWQDEATRSAFQPRIVAYNSLA